MASGPKILHALCTITLHFCSPFSKILAMPLLPTKNCVPLPIIVLNVCWMLSALAKKIVSKTFYFGNINLTVVPWYN